MQRTRCTLHGLLYERLRIVLCLIAFVKLLKIINYHDHDAH